MSTSLSEQKRAYLKRAVEQLKATGVLQKDIAARMGDNEGAFSGKLGGGRGITDDYIDRFVSEFKIPFAAGALAEQGVTLEMVERLVKSADAQATLMVRIMSELENLRVEIGRLKK